MWMGPKTRAASSRAKNDLLPAALLAPDAIPLGTLRGDFSCRGWAWSLPLSCWLRALHLHCQPSHYWVNSKQNGAGGRFPLERPWATPFPCPPGEVMHRSDERPGMCAQAVPPPLAPPPYPPVITQQGSL